MKARRVLPLCQAPPKPSAKICVFFMLLSLTTTHSPATDLGFLLHKNPTRVHERALSFGKARVFYSEASDEKCTAALLLEVDPIALVRGKGKDGGRFDQYVNDRPYVASSFLSVAIAQLFREAMKGQSKDRPELAQTPIPLIAKLDVVPSRGGEGFLRKLFESLGYEVSARGFPLDENFLDWGQSPYFSLGLRATKTLSELLTHLYVLIPVLDDEKHYFVGDDEVEKLLKRGEGWLQNHPERETIIHRYLKRRRSLARAATEQLLQSENPDADEQAEIRDAEEAQIEKPLSLHQQRLDAVLGVLQQSGATRVLDLGCGEGRLLRALLKEKQYAEIVGMDVSHRSLEMASDKLKLERMPETQRARLKLLQGSLTYRDARLENFDAAAVVEVIEHLDESRLYSFERVLFKFAAPQTIVITTPNREYNSVWETLPAGNLRHKDHRFEWTRSEFQNWAQGVASRREYSVEISPVGPEDESRGAPSQMAVFRKII
jgi:3' terminal RNA ribose 2'-O-methyltransferase Hen1